MQQPSRDLDELSEDHSPWQSAPRETLLLIFNHLSLKERALVVGAVCSWWRRVAVEGGVPPEVSLCSVPIFAVRAQQLERFEEQRDSFLHWLRARAPRIRSLIVQAEHWEAFLNAQDDDRSLGLRVATAQMLSPHLRSLKLVSSQGGGHVTQTFLSLGGHLRWLQLDFWGINNWLSRTLTCCTALTALHIQCSSSLGGTGSLGALASLRELVVVDGGWGRIPPEVTSLPCLTRLFLRYAEFESKDWLGAAAGGSGSGGGSGDGCPNASSNSSSSSSGSRRGLPWRDLTLFGCHLSALPPAFASLTALTALRLDRNGSLMELPATLAALSSLQVLSLEGCLGMMSLGEGVPELPLRSLNVQETNILRLPPGSYTATLTELFWGPANWAPLLPSCIQNASVLKILYLGAQLDGEQVQQCTRELFHALPHLEKVCVPQSGRVLWRDGKPAVH